MRAIQPYRAERCALRRLAVGLERRRGESYLRHYLLYFSPDRPPRGQRSAYHGASMSSCEWRLTCVADARPARAASGWLCPPVDCTCSRPRASAARRVRQALQFIVTVARSSRHAGSQLRRDAAAPACQPPPLLGTKGCGATRRCGPPVSGKGSTPAAAAGRSAPRSKARKAEACMARWGKPPLPGNSADSELRVKSSNAAGALQPAVAEPVPIFCPALAWGSYRAVHAARPTRRPPVARARCPDAHRPAVALPLSRPTPTRASRLDAAGRATDQHCRVRGERADGRAAGQIDVTAFAPGVLRISAAVFASTVT